MNLNQLVTTLEDVNKKLLRHAARAINISVTLRNWLYGYYIQEYEINGSDRASYGDKILENLAKELQSKNISATSRSQLHLCRQFYSFYPYVGEAVFALSEKEFKKPLLNIVQTPSGKLAKSDIPRIANEILIRSLSFSHFVELFKIEEPLKRSFYEIECIKGSWSVRQLKRQINSLYYERSGLSKDKKKLSQLIQQEAITQQPQDVVRDPYVFEFLGLKPQEIILESRLADALINKLQAFLLELGKGFCFEARNKRILIGEKYYFIDLVFYHRVLKCSVIIELKSDEFNHHNIGQLNTYINYFKRHEMNEGDNAPIGILLCTHKDEALVEYAVGDTDNQLFVSKYKLELPSEEMMKQFIEAQLKDNGQA